MSTAGPETKQQHWLRRGRELNRMNKAGLCALYRRLGGLGGIHPPEKWRKDEVINSIVDIEWGRLPDDRKASAPEPAEPSCAHGCGLAVGEHTRETGHWFTYPTGV